MFLATSTAQAVGCTSCSKCTVRRYNTCTYMSRILLNEQVCSYVKRIAGVRCVVCCVVVCRGGRGGGGGGGPTTLPSSTFTHMTKTQGAKTMNFRLFHLMYAQTCSFKRILDVYVQALYVRTVHLPQLAPAVAFYVLMSVHI